MKSKNILTMSAVIFGSIVAQAARYELTVTNGSRMPVSPSAIFVKTGSESLAAIASVPTAGFIQLCQTGNPAARITELKANANVKSAVQTMGPILPGQTVVVEVEVANPEQQSIQFEAMYGKTKDVCAVASANSHSLVALKQHVTTDIEFKDSAYSTGAFSEPTLPAGMTYLDESICAQKMASIDCIRELSTAANGNAQIRFFSGYFPSLVTALEARYGAADVQTLLFPTSGAIQFKLKLKH